MLWTRRDAAATAPKPGRPLKLEPAREAELSQAILAGPDRETLQWARSDVGWQHFNR
jgi:hypothetical protein